MPPTGHFPTAKVSAQRLVKAVCGILVWEAFGAGMLSAPLSTH